ncbi:MAG TPA: hypothetical protein VF702_02560 [Allosphingosinicella sp.]|jgi:hypothetical protein
MYELDLAFFESMIFETMPLLADVVTAEQTPLEDKLNVPPGTEIMTVTDIIINSYGEEELVPKVLIRVPDSTRYVPYNDWLFDQKPDYGPDSGWEIGQTYDKDGYTIIAVSTIAIVNGQEVTKPLLYIREDGDSRMYRLDGWEEKQTYLDKLAYLEKPGYSADPTLK